MRKKIKILPLMTIIFILIAGHSVAQQQWVTLEDLKAAAKLERDWIIPVREKAVPLRSTWWQKCPSLQKRSEFPPRKIKKMYADWSIRGVSPWEHRLWPKKASQELQKKILCTLSGTLYVDIQTKGYAGYNIFGSLGGNSFRAFSDSVKLSSDPKDKSRINFLRAYLVANFLIPAQPIQFMNK